MANLGGRPTAALVLEPDEREYLERQVRRRRVARSMSERCRIVLRCDDGRFVAALLPLASDPQFQPQKAGPLHKFGIDLPRR